MRLGYLISQYPAVNHTFILREVRGLRELGFDPVLVSVRPPDRARELMTPEEREEAARTFHLQAAGLWRCACRHLATLLLRPAGYFRGLALALRLAGWDLRKAAYHLLYFAEAVVAGQWMARHRVVHAHVHFSSTVGLLMTRVFPLSMSLTIHGPDEFLDPAGSHLRRKVQAARFVCAISNYGRSQLMKTAPYEEWRKLELAPLGVDTSVYAPRPFRECPSRFELLSVGRLAPAKGQHVLIDALALLAGQDRRLRLRLAGDGTERISLQRHIAALGLQGIVILEGWLAADRVRELYQGADLFVLPSFAEGVPVVLMEAMAMEIPCVATRVAGIPELIRDGIEGLLVDASDARQLAGAIAGLMDDPALRLRMGRAARLRVMACYDLRSNTTRLAEIFRRNLGSSIGSGA
jgi:glycosyltransferase involved in cell wall biosynthesis